MNILTQHTQKQGVTYVEHWVFAMGIAKRLLDSVIAFTLHAIFPFIDIDKKLDLEETVRFIEEKNAWIEGKKLKSGRRNFGNAVWQTENT